MLLRQASSDISSIKYQVLEYQVSHFIVTKIDCFRRPVSFLRILPQCSYELLGRQRLQVAADCHLSEMQERPTVHKITRTQRRISWRFFGCLTLVACSKALRANNVQVVKYSSGESSSLHQARDPFLPDCIEEVDVLNGAWDITHFGRTGCWGRRPLLMKGAFTDVIMQTDPPTFPSWSEIVDLACCASSAEDQDMAEAMTCRLIQHSPNALDSFTLEFGPFESSSRIGTILHSNDHETASTLVLNDVDRWIPDLSDWMDENFKFLPRWRRDDAQVSLADTGGGIGPHVDNYDVFLIQTSGSRRWEVGLRPLTVKEEFDTLVEKSQVRIINTTEISTETVSLDLGPGDCLYLPPRFMHWGTAVSRECVTLSVGCRAPSAADLMSKLAETAAISTMESAVRRYTDTRIFENQVGSRKIGGEVKEQMKQMIVDLVDDIVGDDELWDDLVGKLITQPNRPVADYPMPLKAMDSEWRNELGVFGDPTRTIDAVLEGVALLRRAEGVSFAWSIVEEPNLGGRLYAQGRVFEVKIDKISSLPTAEIFLDHLVNGQHISSAVDLFDVFKKWPSARNVLHELLDEGYLYGDTNVKSMER